MLITGIRFNKNFLSQTLQALCKAPSCTVELFSMSESNLDKLKALDKTFPYLPLDQAYLLSNGTSITDEDQHLCDDCFILPSLE